MQDQARKREAEEKKLKENEFSSTFKKFMAQKKVDEDQKRKGKAIASMRELMKTSKNEHKVNNRKFEYQTKAGISEKLLDFARSRFVATRV